MYKKTIIFVGLLVLAISAMTLMSEEEGQGSDSEIAKNNGINKTAQKTAKKLVALINSKGIN